MTPDRLACPKCRRSIAEVYWQGVDIVRCPACEGEFEQVRFPALSAKKSVELAAALGAGEANCYFHSQNRAESACQGCGRYVCSVCKVSFAGQQLCPSCLEAREDRRKLPENHRVLYEHVALVVAVLPLIMWPLTLLTAPVALGVIIFGWKKPASLLPRRRRLIFIIAGLAATAEICGWMILFGSLWLRKH